MNKKIIAVASIAGVLVLGVGAFAVGAVMNSRNIAVENSVYEESIPEVGILTELKIGKYYLENGTQDEYIEVYDDNTMQFFGYDYIQSLLEIPANRHITSLGESEYAEFVAGCQDEIDFWNSRNFYFLNEHGQSILLSDEPILSSRAYRTLSYTDENTICLGKEHIYKFAE